MAQLGQHATDLVKLSCTPEPGVLALPRTLRVASLTLHMDLNVKQLRGLLTAVTALPLLTQLTLCIARSLLRES